MGANLNTYSFQDSAGKSKILEFWKELVEQSLHEDGHSYSGCIGMLRGSPTFNDLNLVGHDAAHEYIAENHYKGTPPMAVSYTDNKGFKWWQIGGWCRE